MATTTAFEICDMAAGDVGDCTEIFRQAAAGLRAGQGLPASTRPPTATAARIAFLQQHDPAGSWVARDSGTAIGFAQAALRDDLWLLAHLFVAPEHQARGVGTALLQRAHEYGLGVPLGIISSSADPLAIGRYARLPGFRVYPALRCFGDVRGGDRPPGIGHGSAADLGHANRIDRALLGTCRGDDLAHLLAGDAELLIADDGYAIATPGGPTIVAALDEDTAARLLVAALAHVPAGTHVEFGRITGEQQWAIRCLLERGLRLRPQGPLVLRGRTPPTPYLPHMAFS
ncbi:MAG TPA: GNAT family N-acetyltransferase [Reyranella sp.]